MRSPLPPAESSRPLRAPVSRTLATRLGSSPISRAMVCLSCPDWSLFPLICSCRPCPLFSALPEPGCCLAPESLCAIIIRFRIPAQRWCHFGGVHHFKAFILIQIAEAALVSHACVNSVWGCVRENDKQRVGAFIRLLSEDREEEKRVG